MIKGKLMAENGVYFWHCPGCEFGHAVHTKAANTTGAKWNFNGDFNKPTFSPSILVNKGQANPTQPVCHCFVKDGMIEFLNDCTHHLAGKTVQMEDAE